MPFKLLTTSDLHLGKKSSNVPRSLEESSTRFTWHWIIQWAVEHEVDVMVLTGKWNVDRDNHFFEAIGPHRIETFKEEE